MKYCLIGAKLGYSYSALVHGRFGLDYSLLEVAEKDLAKFIKENPFDGFNVTIPYKRAVMPYLDCVSEEAERIGAVNTVVKKDGKLFGYNTDAAGFEYAVKRKGVSLKDKNVLVLGSGGAAAVARFVAQKTGARRVDTVSRGGKINYENCYDLKDAEIIINATPVGTFPDISETPIFPEKFPAVKFVMDMTYNPFNTELLRRAKEAGAKTSSGLSMLVKQAIESERLWGFNADDNACEDAAFNIYKQKSNLILIGMPSSGKSSLGKILAEKLGKTFVDTDDEIVKKTGLSPEKIILTRGESSLRDVESKVIEDLSLSFGCVIATGGGAVLRPENSNLLSKNGVICYIKRDISLLSTKGRPLSKVAGTERLFEERRPLYEKYCDFSAENDGDIKDTAKEIIKKYEDTCRQRT